MTAGAGVPFLKGHGTENDFVLLPDVDARLELTPGVVAALCDRRAGVGGDGVLRVVPTAAEPEVAAYADEAPWFMDYRNGDGSVAEMCGNGIRVFARYLVEAGLAEPGTLQVATRAGVKAVRVGRGGDVRVDMGAPRLVATAVPVSVAGRHLAGTSVSMGNPHCVVLLDEPLEPLDLTPAPVVLPDDYPDGVNVEVVRPVGERHVQVRVHERGVGETRSCGTGVCAAAYAAALAAAPDVGPAPGRWTVDVPGGRLTVELTRATSYLTGPAVLVAEGTLRADWVAATRRQT